MADMGYRSSQGAQGPQGSSVQKTTDRVAEKAQASVENAQSRVAEQLSAVAQAIGSAADTLERKQQTGLSRRFRQYVQKVENVSQQVREKSPRELKADVDRIARRQPAWFLGGAFLLGVLSARFLKSSQQESSVEYARA